MATNMFIMMWSSWSPHGPHHLYVVPVIPTSSSHHPHHPHIVPTPQKPTPETHPPTPWGTPGISKNSIRLELIEIFQFCLKFYDLLRHPHLWVGVWVVEWMDWLMGGSMAGIRSNH